MTGKPGTAGRFTLDFVPSMASPMGMTKANWRISDAQDNRVATAYDETHGRMIVDALNGAPIVSDPTAVEIVAENVAKLAAMVPGGTYGADLAHIVAMLELASGRLMRSDGLRDSDTRAAKALAEHARIMVRVGARPMAWIDESGRANVDTDASHAMTCVALEKAIAWVAELKTPDAPTIAPAGGLEPDPYAEGSATFADAFHSSNPSDVSRVRQRIVDDVKATHAMLDALAAPGGMPLSARLGAMLAPFRPERLAEMTLTPASFSTTLPADVLTGRRSEPLADSDAVKVPEPADLMAVLNQLTAEETFRVFDYVKVLPPDPDAVRAWVLTDPADVEAMVATCLGVALESNKLGDVYREARRALDRAVRP